MMSDTHDEDVNPYVDEEGTWHRHRFFSGLGQQAIHLHGQQTCGNCALEISNFRGDGKVTQRLVSSYLMHDYVHDAYRTDAGVVYLHTSAADGDTDHIKRGKLEVDISVDRDVFFAGTDDGVEYILIPDEVEAICPHCGFRNKLRMNAFARNRMIDAFDGDPGDVPSRWLTDLSDKVVVHVSDILREELEGHQMHLYDFEEDHIERVTGETFAQI